MFRKKKASIIFIIIQFLSECLLTYALIDSGMIPAKYLIAAIAVELIALVAAWFLAFVNIELKVRKQKVTRRAIAAVIACLMLIVSLVAYIALDKVGDTLDEISSEKSVTSVIGVYVRSNDAAKSLKDAKNYHFGYTKAFDAKNTIAAIDSMEDELGIRPKATNYEDVNELVKAFYGGKIDAIIVNESYASIISDQEEFAGFNGDTKIIYEYKIESAVQDKANKPKKKKSSDLKSFIIYLSGSDNTSKSLSGGRSDVNILMVANTETKEILLINTPRDYYVPISVSGYGARDKLTHCGIYGVECSMDTLANLYSTDVDYYARINFTGFATLIDAIGGITVYSDEAFCNTSDNPLLDGTSLVIQKGENNLNGAQALAFARERVSVSGGDNGRGINQMKMITAVIDKMSAGTILKNYSDILESLEGMFATDMPSKDITKLVKMQLNDMASWNIHSYAVTGYGGMNVTYSMPGASLYVTHPDQASVDRAAKLIDRVIAGKTLTDDDLK